MIADRLKQAQDGAHSLKGASLCTGAGRLAEVALAIEQLGAVSDIKRTTILIDDLETATDEVRGLIDQMGAADRQRGSAVS